MDRKQICARGTGLENAGRRGPDDLKKLAGTPAIFLKMRNQGHSANLKRPGYLIPAWIKQSRRDSLTPGRLTPARCRFTAAAADHAWKTRPDFLGCKACVSASIATLYRVPDHCCLVPSHPVFSLLLLLARAICRDGSYRFGEGSECAVASGVAASDSHPRKLVRDGKSPLIRAPLFVAKISASLARHSRIPAAVCANRWVRRRVTTALRTGSDAADAR